MVTYVPTKMEASVSEASRKFDKVVRRRVGIESPPEGKEERTRVSNFVFAHAMPDDCVTFLRPSQTISWQRKKEKGRKGKPYFQLFS